jgi:hypothetical protein
MKATAFPLHNTGHIIQSSGHVNYHAFSTEIDETSEAVQVIAGQFGSVMSPHRTTMMSTTSINKNNSPPIVQVPNGKLFRNKPEILYGTFNMGSICFILLLVELEHLV